MLNLDRYVASVTGRALNVDGAYGAQCWDLWSHYAQQLGVPYLQTLTRAGGSAPHPGWACNVWHNADDVAAIRDRFERLQAKGGARAGDVAFWERDADLYPGSHVAVVLEDRGDRLLVLSQNPGPPVVMTLPKRTLLGYLRPRPGLLDVKASTPAPAPSPTPAPQLPAPAGSVTITREDPLMAYRILREGNNAHFENGYGVVEVETAEHLKMLRDVDRAAAKTKPGDMVAVGPTQLRTIRAYHRKARG